MRSSMPKLAATVVEIHVAGCISWRVGIRPHARARDPWAPVAETTFPAAGKAESGRGRTVLSGGHDHRISKRPSEEWLRSSGRLGAEALGDEGLFGRLSFCRASKLLGREGRGKAWDRIRVLARATTVAGVRSMARAAPRLPSRRASAGPLRRACRTEITSNPRQATGWRMQFGSLVGPAARPAGRPH